MSRDVHLTREMVARSAMRYAATLIGSWPPSPNADADIELASAQLDQAVRDHAALLNLPHPRPGDYLRDEAGALWCCAAQSGSGASVMFNPLTGEFRDDLDAVLLQGGRWDVIHAAPGPDACTGREAGPITWPTIGDQTPAAAHGGTEDHTTHAGPGPGSTHEGDN